MELTRRMPGTSITACSIGRMTLSIMERAGSVPEWAITRTLGKLKGG